MKTLEKIKDINNKAIFSGICFFTMGATAFFTASSPVASFGLISMIPSLAYICSEFLNKHRIIKNEHNPVIFSFLPSVYKTAFTRHFKKYLNESDCELEKKYKMLITCFVFEKIGLDPKTIIIDKTRLELINKYNISTKDGKIIDIFDGTNSYICYDELTHQDFKDPQKLKIAQKVYQDFRHLGLLGKEVSRIFGYNSHTSFLLKINTYKLNQADIKHIEKATFKKINTPNDSRTMNQAAQGKEEEFIFDIIDSNPQHIKTLHKFHTEIHCHDSLCSYPKLIKFINERLNIFQVKEKLDIYLPEKSEAKLKPKKI